MNTALHNLVTLWLYIGIGAIVLLLVVGASLALRKKRATAASGGKAATTVSLTMKRIWKYIREHLMMTIAILSVLLINLWLLPHCWFPGFSDWMKEFFIKPVPWGLVTLGLGITWSAFIIAHAAKKETKLFSVMKSLVLYVVVTAVIIQLGILVVGEWWGFKVFGYDPFTSGAPELFVDVTNTHADSVFVPLQKESYTLTRVIHADESFVLESVTPVNANVDRLLDNGYVGFSKYGPLADTGDGVQRNLDVVTTRAYQAKCFNKWKNRPAYNPFKTEDLDWNVPLNDNRVPYGALLVQLDGERYFLREGERVKAKSTQPITLLTNFESGRHRLTLGGYAVKFSLDKY